MHVTQSLSHSMTASAGGKKCHAGFGSMPKQKFRPATQKWDRMLVEVALCAFVVTIIGLSGMT